MLIGKVIDGGVFGIGWRRVGSGKDKRDPYGIVRKREALDGGMIA